MINNFSRRSLLGGIAASLPGTVVLSNGAGAIEANSNPEARLAPRVYNVRDFGAKGDGLTLDTVSLQGAIDACACDGGGTVFVPSGTFMIGTTELKSNVTLHLDAGATLLGSADIRHYRPAGSNIRRYASGQETLAILIAVRAKNIAIEGSGTIDGQGDRMFDRIGDHAPRPHHVFFIHCERVRLRDLRLLNSAYFSVLIDESKHICIEGVFIESRVNTNNDGFHFMSAEHVAMNNCTVFCGDDACALQGSCQFVTITNCVFSTRWSVFRIFGFPYGGGVVRNITVSNCLIQDTFGCPIKIEASGMQVENLSFSNLTLQNVTGPICVNLGEANEAENVDPSSPFERDSYVRGLSFQNLRATVVKEPDDRYAKITTYGPVVFPGEQNSCISFNGTGKHIVEDVTLDNVHVMYAGGGSRQLAKKREIGNSVGEYMTPWSESPFGPPCYGLYARNVRGMTLNNVRLEVVEPDFRSAVIFDNVQDAAIIGLQAQGNPEADSVVRLKNVGDALLTACRVLSPAAVFLRLEGTRTQNIKVDGGDLSKAVRSTVLRNGAPIQSLKMRLS